MKKFFVFVLAIAIFSSVGVVSYAEGSGTFGEQTQVNVNVEISWDSLQFVYTDG